jgi:hypothetical protein
VSIRKRNVKRTPRSRTALLEEKVDNIVSQLQSQTNDGQSQQAASPHTYHDTSSSLNEPPTSATLPSSSTPQSNVNVSSTAITDFLPVCKISDMMAEEHLKIFRLAFLPFFPFFHIPPTINVSDLRIQKPFFWLVILCLTTKLVSQQFALGHQIRQIVSQKVVVEHDRSLDLLLGMICYLAW